MNSVSANMSGWKARIDIVQLYDYLDENSKIKEIGAAALEVIAKINLSLEYGKFEELGVNPHGLERIIEDMELEISGDCLGANAFDYYIAEIYDWADNARVIIGDYRHKNDGPKLRQTSQTVLGRR